MPTLSTAAYLLKSVFMQNKFIEQFAKDTILWQLFKKDNSWITKGGIGQGSGTPASYGMIWPIEDQRNGSVGAFDMSTAVLLPPGGRQGVQAYTNMKATQAGLILDAILFDASNKDETMFENIVKRNMKTIFDDLKNAESRMMWGDGNGVLGVVASISGATITLSNSVSGNYFPLTKFLSVGQYITVLTSGYATRSATGIYITAMDETAGTITVSDAGSIAATDLIFNYISFDVGDSSGNEPMGLRGIGNNTSTLFGVNPSTYGKWVPAKITSTNTDPTEDFFEVQKAYIAMGGGTPKCVITHPLVQSKYGSALKTYKRVVNTVKVTGGIQTSNDYQKLEGPEIVGVGPMIADSNTPMGVDPDTFHEIMLDTDTIFLGEASPIGWLEQDGSMFKFLTGSATVAAPSYAKYVAYLLHVWQMGVYKRRDIAMCTNMNMLKG